MNERERANAGGAAADSSSAVCAVSFVRAAKKVDSFAKSAFGDWQTFKQAAASLDNARGGERGDCDKK